MVIVIDLEEAEFHKPKYGDTIASFIAHHVMLLPPCLKFVVSVEPQFDDVTRLLPFIRLSLDPLAPVNLTSYSSIFALNQHDFHIADDVIELVLHRVTSSVSLAKHLGVAGARTGVTSDAREKVVCYLNIW